MDGRYDDDFNFVFNAGNNAAVTGLGTSETILLAIRLGPSVDNGRIGLLGVREIINRMSLRLRSIDAIASGTVRVSCILNGRANSALNFTNIGGSSLAQVYQGSGAGVVLNGGENVFSFFCGTGVSQQDLSSVRELGNSINGGGTSLALSQTFNNIYPDGPDVLYITGRAVTGTPTINSRLSWTEAQA
jgi:hypothetical protein